MCQGPSTPRLGIFLILCKWLHLLPLRGSRPFPGSPNRTDSASLGCQAFRFRLFRFYPITTNPPVGILARASWMLTPERERGLLGQRKSRFGI